MAKAQARARRMNGAAPAKALRVAGAAFLAALGAMMLLAALLQGATAQNGGRTAAIVSVTGVITPVTERHIARNLRDAVGRYDLVVLEMDTPGGLDASTREINKAILGSKVPVVTYVYPEGSRAASAGTYILYASHVAAMAPSTTLGAATPVQIAGGGGGGGDGGGDSQPAGVEPPIPADTGGTPAATDGETSGESSEGGQDSSGTSEQDAGTPDDGLSSLERKVINDSAAYIRGLAEKRGRNADWAEKAVREAASLSANEALEINVIDVVARDYDDLFTQIDGKEVDVDGTMVTLETEGMQIERMEMSWAEELLAVITNPNVALILMQIGVLGLIVELYNPGAIFPGVVGLICLIMGLYSLSVLPVNLAGIALLVLGVLLVIGELLIVSGGILAVSGVIAFALGGMLLFDTDQPELQVSPYVAIGSSLVIGGTMLLIVMYALNAQRRKVVSGAQTVLGTIGTVTSWEGDEGYVHADGENWRAVSKSPLQEGQKVKVVSLDGLTLTVEPA